MSESFEDVMAFMRKAVTDDCDQTYCAMYDDDCYACEGAVLDRLQRAHDHEMEQLRRLRFREGYEAGQRSMDAEHYAVALRLKHLPLDEDSHGNLSQIARAIWHSDFGWTKGACEALRDELVRLLGGVHEIESGGAASCACDAGCDCGCEQPQTVMYDELGNERHKAVCRLREIQTDAGGFVKALAEAVGVEWQAPRVHQTIAEVRDRLIHLLGGDEPTAMEYIQRIVRKHDIKCLDMEPSGTDESNSQKSPILANSDGEDGGKVTITDELRKFKGHINAELTPEMVLALRAAINCIADRIDEQFNRICWQQEAVLQHTIDTMVDERDKLRTILTQQRDEARAKVLKLDSEASELQKKLDEYKSLFERYRGSYVQYVGEYNVLQRALRRIAKRAGVPDEVDLSECDNALLHKLTIERIDSMHEYIGALEWQRDRQRKLLDEYERRDTVEDIVRDIHLGKVTDSEAVERIRELP